MLCKSCQQLKQPSEFYNSNKVTCKLCLNERNRNWKKNNKQKVKKPLKRDFVLVGPVEPPEQRRSRKYKEWYATSDSVGYYQKHKESQKQDRKNNPTKYILIRAKNRAKEKGLEFNLDESDIIIPSHCPILGVELIPNCAKRSVSISIDRIDSSLGYIKGNVWIISGKANVMKNNASLDDLLKFGQWAVKFSEERKQLQTEGSLL